MVMSSITTSLVVVSIASTQSIKTGKKKMVDYVAGNIANKINISFDFQPIVIVSPYNDEVNKNLSSPSKVSNFLSDQINGISPPNCNLLPSDPFGINSSMMLYHEDIAIANFFNSFGGGVEKAIATPKRLESITLGNEDLLETGKEFLIELEHYFHFASSDQAVQQASDFEASPALSGPSDSSKRKNQNDNEAGYNFNQDALNVMS